MTDKDLIDKLILEWSWRCEKGYPDLSNEEDLKVLEELLELDLNKTPLFEKIKDSSLYALDYESSEKEGKKVYVLKKDLEVEGDKETQKIKPNADRFVLKQKGKSLGYEKLQKDQPETKQPSKNKETEYVEQTLHNIGVPPDQIQAAVTHPLFRTAHSIGEFKQKKDKYFHEFKFLYSSKGEQGGRGELIPFVSILGAKLGGGSEKDIKVGSEVLEVKEISGGKDSGEFSTATSGGIVGSTFVQNLETFQKHLKPFETDHSYEERLRNLFTISTHTVSKENLGYIQGLLKDFPISSKSLSTDFERIKFRGKYYAISKGGEASFKLDDSGNLISSTQQLRELDSKQATLQKVLEHPWVKNPQEFNRNLEDLKNKAMEGVNYYLFFKKKNADFIEVVEPKDRKIQLNRITKSQVNLKYVHKDEE